MRLVLGLLGVASLAAVIAGAAAPNGRGALDHGSAEAASDGGSAAGLAGSPTALAGVGATHYTPIDLGTAAVRVSYVKGINNTGQVVGQSCTTVNPVVCHAFLWEDGVMTDLGTLGGWGSQANSINDAGQVVGWSDVAIGARAFIWENGVMSALSKPPSAVASYANDINDAGDVVGSVEYPYDPVLNVHHHPALWAGGGAPVELAVPPADSHGVAYGINSAGQIVGGATYTQESGFEVFRATLWDPGINDVGLAAFGPGYSYALKINDSGQVVGSSDSAGSYVWQNGEATVLGAGGIATDINNRGQVVGSADVPFLWEDGVVRDLNDLIDPASGWILQSAEAINDGGQIVGVGRHNGVSSGFLLNPGRRPVFILPGIVGTYAADVSADLFWLTQRGIAPSELQIDPLSGAYDNLIQTLKNVGYVEGEDLFVVNYDWRLPPGPDDGIIDGQISGLTGASISDGSYGYGVDYFGALLKQAADTWATNHPDDPPLDAVDVIAHSTGGLVARTYIESAAYGDAYAAGKDLPRINNLIMVGVPNRGASKAWNPLHDNWGGDLAFQAVLSKIVNRAYQKVLGGAVITGPDHNISLASLTAPQCLDSPEICFIDQYIPTARALLATYDFIDFGAGFTNVNTLPETRNSWALDLNAGLDLAVTGDPNAFADLATVTVIYGTNGADTPVSVVEQTGPTFYPPGFLPIAPFADFVGRNAGSGEVYYTDIKDEDAGDGTVPLESSIGQFLFDSRVTLLPFTQGGNTTGSVRHAALTSNVEVQTAILETLGIGVESPDDISTDEGGFDPSIVCAVTGCLNFILDPVEGFVVDGQGRRLGYSTATGPLTEIPGSIWFGNADGMGWVFGPVEGPLSVNLTGVGDNYYVMLSLFSGTATGGVISEGVLAQDEQLVILVPDTGVPPETATPTASPADTATPTPTNTATSTPTDTATPTNTATATNTPTNTATSTNTPTSTAARTATRTPTATTVPATGPSCADFDGDGVVTVSDILTLLSQLRRGQYASAYDLNRDGRLTVHDLVMTVRQFGRRCP